MATLSCCLKQHLQAALQHLQAALQRHPDGYRVKVTCCDISFFFPDPLIVVAPDSPGPIRRDASSTDAATLPNATELGFRPPHMRRAFTVLPQKAWAGWTWTCLLDLRRSLSSTCPHLKASPSFTHSAGGRSICLVQWTCCPGTSPGTVSARPRQQRRFRQPTNSS